LAEPDEQTPWLVDGLLPQAGLSIIAARPKSGKSTLARTLTLAVARGERVLDRHTTAGTVLYLALEEKKRAELRRQFRMMGASDEPIQFYCATAPADGVAQLSEAVMRDSPALVIIDPPLSGCLAWSTAMIMQKCRWLWSRSLP
jgi:RecA-family ATPase